MMVKPVDEKYFEKIRIPIYRMIERMRDPMTIGIDKDSTDTILIADDDKPGDYSAVKRMRVILKGAYYRPDMTEFTVQCKCMVPLSDTGSTVVGAMGIFSMRCGIDYADFDRIMTTTMIDELVMRYLIEHKNTYGEVCCPKQEYIAALQRAAEDSGTGETAEEDRAYLTTPIILRAIHEELKHMIAQMNVEDTSYWSWTKGPSREAKSRVVGLFKATDLLPMDPKDPFNTDIIWHGKVVDLYKGEHVTGYTTSFKPYDSILVSTIYLTRTEVAKTTSYAGEGFASTVRKMSFSTILNPDMYSAYSDKIQMKHFVIWLDRLTDELNKNLKIIDKISTPSSDDVVISIPWFNQDDHPIVL